MVRFFLVLEILDLFLRARPRLPIRALELVLADRDRSRSLLDRIGRSRGVVLALGLAAVVGVRFRVAGGVGAGYDAMAWISLSIMACPMIPASIGLGWLVLQVA